MRDILILAKHAERSGKQRHMREDFRKENPDVKSIRDIGKA